MREILFRGQTRRLGEWVEGFYYVQKHRYAGDDRFFGEHATITTGINEAGGGWGESISTIEYIVIPETVGQYTGLTDKNGKKIFEGDICRNTKTGDIVSVKWHGTMAGYVWSKRKENHQHLFDFGELFRVYDKYEVIGNIHDNPELLEGGE
jgi:uncharacterized phage protein (TIGR01671 family)